MHTRMTCNDMTTYLSLELFDANFDGVDLCAGLRVELVGVRTDITATLCELPLVLRLPSAPVRGNLRVRLLLRIL